MNLNPEIKETTIQGYNAVANQSEYKYMAQKAYNGNELKYYLIEVIDVQKAIDEIYRISDKWGANAIFNLRINSTTTTDIVVRESITVSGLAVRI